jgi:hypothetical protein
MSIVFVGSFNPEVFHPSWLFDQGFISEQAAQFAISSSETPLVMTPGFTTFATDWLQVQVRGSLMVMATSDDSRQLELKDFALGILTLLPETPVSAIGINKQVHFRAESAEAWNDFGDRFLPKEVWETVIPEGPWVVREGGLRVGLKNVTIEVSRDESVSAGQLHLQVAPSELVLYGVYCAANCHFGPPQIVEPRETAEHFAVILKDEWANAMRNNEYMISAIGESL